MSSPFLLSARRDHTKGMKSRKLASIRKSSGIYSVIIVSNLVEILFLKGKIWRVRENFARLIGRVTRVVDFDIFFSFQAMNYPTSRADVLKNII